MKNAIVTKIAFGVTVLFICVFFACKNKTTDPTPPPVTPPPVIPPPVTPPPTATCKLVTQSSTENGSTASQSYKFEYDADGNPSRVSYFTNGGMKLDETVKPTEVNIIETPSNSPYQKTTYDVSYVDKKPKTYVIHAGSGLVLAGVFTYDSKGRLAAVKGGFASSTGVLDETQATTVALAYDDNDNLTTAVYRGPLGNVLHTYTATGYDTHNTPFSGIKNSVFLQYDFYWFSTDYDKPRHLFDHLSAHNVLGYTHNSGSGSFIEAETFKYTYNDKGQPTQRDASSGEAGQTPTKGYFDAWAYDCK